MKREEQREFISNFKEDKTKKEIKINRQKLEKVKTKDNEVYSSIVFIGDIHYGSPQCDEDKVVSTIKYCYENNCYVFLMGDLIETGTRYSVGDSVYTQKNPGEQINWVKDVFKPLSNKGLILGCLSGNHEERVTKEVGIDVMKEIIAPHLNIPYLGAAGWSIFYVGNQSYTLYTIHGSSGSRYPHTKLKAVNDLTNSFNADLICMGHVHELADLSTLYQTVDRKNKMVVEKKRHVLLTGHYLKYDGGYAQAKGMGLSRLGSPKVKLFGNKKDVHISL